MRLVSLLPSATEIVYALGLDEQLVGVTFECDEPPAARAEKTVVVGGLDTGGMTPREIDDYVRGQLASGAELYTLHAQALAALRPDLIITQDLCRVCALPTGQVSDALDYLGCQAEVLSLDPHSLDEVIESIVAVGRRTGIPGRAARLAAGLRARLDRVAAGVAGLPRPRVAVAEWVDPPFTAGHWVPDLITAAGGLPVVGQSGQRSAETSWAAVAAAEPDLVIVAPCGYHLAGAADQAATAAAALAEAVRAEAALAETALAETALAEAALAETALAETALAETALAETALAETALAETALAETALAETALAETALAETALAETALAETALAETALAETALAETALAETALAETALAETALAETALAETALAETALAETALAETALAETALAETALAETALAETALAETALAETALAETALAETALAETALPGVPVWAIDADGIVVRPGPRLVDGVEAIASVLHPDAVPPAAPGTVQRIA